MALEIPDVTGIVIASTSGLGLIGTVVWRFAIQPFQKVGQSHDELQNRVSKLEQQVKNMEDSNTRELAEELKRRYPDRKIIVYPDPSGKQRNSASSRSNHSLLKQYGFTVRAHSKAPRVADRINCVNAMLCNVNGERRLFIHPNCQNLKKRYVDWFTMIMDNQIRIQIWIT